MTNLYKMIKSRDHHIANKDPYSQSHAFFFFLFSVVVYRCENWTIKKAGSWGIDNCFWSVVLEKTLKGPLHCREIKPVKTKGNQHRISIARTDAEAEAESPIHWPPDVKSWLWKRSWCWERLKIKEGNDRGGEVDSITNSMDMNLSKLREMVEDRGAWCVAAHGVPRSQTGLSNWATA